jgi:hypothetical protein
MDPRYHARVVPRQLRAPLGEPGTAARSDISMVPMSRAQGAQAVGTAAKPALRGEGGRVTGAVRACVTPHILLLRMQGMLLPSAPRGRCT